MKLASWAVAIAALAIASMAALVPATAGAYVRSNGGGVCLWWRNKIIPVVANVSGISPSVSGVPSGSGCAGPDAVRDLVTSSLATWGSATLPGSTVPCTDVSLRYAGDTTNIAVGFAGRGSDQNTILFRRGLCSSNPCCEGLEPEACADQIGCWPDGSSSRTIAVTTTSYIPSTGEIVDADMELHDRSAEGGFAFTCTATGPSCGASAPSPTCVSTDLGSIVTHEAGHMLGLDHPSDKPEATMYATYVSGTTGLRTLDVDDVEGVCAIYPRGQQVVTCVGGVPPVAAIVASEAVVEHAQTAACKQKSSSSGGCSTAMGGVLSMIGLAFALGRRRSR